MTPVCERVDPLMDQDGMIHVTVLACSMQIYCILIRYSYIHFVHFNLLYWYRRNTCVYISIATVGNPATANGKSSLNSNNLL